jgi:hypothetical protein
MDIFTHPRIHEILIQADNALQLLDSADLGSKTHLKGALDTIYRDIGRSLHALRERPTGLTNPIRPARAPQAPTLPPQAAFSFDSMAVTLRDVVAPDDVADQVGETHHRSLFTDAEGMSDIDPLDDGSWLVPLQDLLALLGPPTRHAQATDVAVEATRIQWATSSTSALWLDYPEPIMLALLGLLSSRARHLVEKLEVASGPKLALDRLRKYHQQKHLRPVQALYDERGPEDGSWVDDAQSWWNILQQGLK